MLKLKFLFELKILITLIGLAIASISNADVCPDLTISGDDKICYTTLATNIGNIGVVPGKIYDYEVNYDKYQIIRWEVTNGDIVLIDGTDTTSFLEQARAQNPVSVFYNGNPSYNNYPFQGPTAPYTIYLTWVWGGSYTVSIDFLNGASITSVLSNLGGGVVKDFLSKREAKKISIMWDGFQADHKVIAHVKGAGVAGVCGSDVYTKQITVESNPYIIANINGSSNLFCNQGSQVSGNIYGSSINWQTSGAVVPQNWGQGIVIDRFTQVGQVPITVIASTSCGSTTKSFIYNITQPDFGHVTQNGNNVDEPGTLVSLDCQGNFYLGMPVWISNAFYTWELPGTLYDAQTNTYTKTIVSGLNKNNVQGKLPADGLTDFIGKVTITGVCGAPVVKTFIIRPTLKPTVDPDIYSCSNSVVIHVNNPTATGNINASVAPTYPSVWGTFANFTPTSVQFTAPSPGAYVINIGINGVGGCYTLLQTTVHAVSAGQNNNSGIAGWQSGVLSDNRKAVGSNIVPYGGNIYFSGRDGKIYFYSFSTALQKWVINEMPGITNASIPASGAFTKIGLATIGTGTYLFYTDNATSKLWKIDLSTNAVSDGFLPTVNASDFITLGNDVYAIQKGTNVLIYNNTPTPFTLANTTLKAIIPGYGIMYVQNNNLYSTWYGQLTYSGDVYASSDMIFYNGFLYFVRGQKGNANLYRVPMPNPNIVEQITTSSNLSGIFNINPASGVIYYGLMNLGAANTIYTQASGSYKGADVYQANLSGTTWFFKKATTVVNYEGLDMLIHSAVYSGNHLYYVGAGHNAATGGSLRELEVWNLYYEDACAPSLQRVGVDLDETVEDSTVLIYPNPFNTELSLDLSAYTVDGNKTTVGVEVVDATGKTVYKAAVLSELASIVTADWSAGIYVVKISYNNKLINKKVVKY